MKTEKKKRILKMLSVFLVCGYAFVGQTIYLEAANGQYATNPTPPDGAVDVSIETNLTWMRGEGAKWDQVYFGTDPCDANLSLVATIPDYLPAEYDPCDPDPGTEPNLLPSTTYYWYITEVNAPNEYQGPVCSFSTIPGEAQCDYPADGAVIPGDHYEQYLYTELIFIPGPTAVQHTGYFSKVRDEVANRAEDAKIPPPVWPPIPHEHKYIVPLPPESLIRGQVYYWTDDETDSFGNTFLGDVWEFTVQDYYAYAPSPVDGANDVDPNVLLSWLPGYGAANHDVFIGTSWEDVNNAYFTYPVHNSSPEYQGTTDPCVLSWQMNGLDPETKYYWRIDEVQGRFPPSPGTIYKGDVWSFSTIPGEAQCDYPEDGAVIAGDYYEQYLYTELIFIPGPTAIQHTGYFSKVRDEVANRVEDVNLGPPPLTGYPGYDYTYFAGHPDYYPYEGLIRGQVYYWCVDETDAQGNTFPGDIWEFGVDFKAFAPSPPNEAVIVESDVLLSWATGIGVVPFVLEHDVYIGTSWENVNDAVYDPINPPPEFLDTVTEPNILVTGLSDNTSYYWRVDIVMQRIYPFSVGTYYKGDVWSFTTVIPVGEKTYHVDGATGDNTNDGLTRETAFETIQRGINVADDHETVLVWPGVYNEEISFWGDAITVQSCADAAVVETNYGYAFSFYSAEGPDTVLSNFIIRDSQYGIYLVNGSSPTLRNLTIVNNDFGISAFNGADPDISNCIFWGNYYGDLFRDPVPLEAKYSWVEDEQAPVAYWKLDGDANDSAGTNHGTIYGATPTTGQVGGALSFDGDDYVQVADDDSLDISNKIAISAWINPSSISSIRMIVSKYKDSAEMSYLLELSNEKLHFMLRDVSSFFGIQTFSTGIWYHVAATYDGSRTRGYINGELDHEQAASGTIPITTQELNIGRQADNNLWPFEGLIDEVRIYDRGLSSEEIEALYNTGLAGHEFGPLFADANSGDYHLLSERGRYWPAHDVWVLDDVTSPCVDGGDPNIDPSNELMPNGGRINMGAYGNTAYASMSEWPIKGDVDRNGRFNFVDIAILLDEWLAELPWAQ